MKTKTIVLLIVIFAFAIRTIGLNWDQGHHLHPDERFLTMVGTDAALPDNFSDYLDPATSTLNPYNIGHGFYVYGTLPVTLNKVVVSAIDRDSYDYISLVGRVMSAVADTLVLILIVLLVQLWEKQYKFDKRLKYFAGFMYAIAVLPIQHAHFFTVDSFANLFIFASVFFALRFYYEPRLKETVLSSISLGLAVATKVSAIYVMPLLIFVFMIGIFQQKKARPIKLLLHAGLFGLIMYFVARIGDPRMFETANFFDISPNKIFLNNIEQLRSFSNPTAWFPPSVQWLSKTPLVFPLRNIIFFGLGIPYFFAMLIGMYQFLTSRKIEFILIVFWVMGFFTFVGSRSVMTMRYFYPLYPFFAIFAGYAILYALDNIKAIREKGNIILISILIAMAIWPMAFLTIYTRPHSRVAASEWIYKNIPEGSVITTEHWDDFLPMRVEGVEPKLYAQQQASVFEPDSDEKIAAMKEVLSKTEYYITTSNRGYGSILPLPEDYYYTASFYRSLFDGTGEFEKVAEFTSYPTVNLGFKEFVIGDQWAEEAFTVYDHPKVSIFKKK